MRIVAPLLLAAGWLSACGLSAVATGVPDVADAAAVPEAGTADADAARPDAALDATPDAGLPPSDPGSIACASKVCKAGTERCCINSAGTDCLSFSDGCVDTEVDCDEPKDCSSAQRCCLGPDNAYPQAWSTVCRGSCAQGYARVCKSDAECDPGVRCLAITCNKHTFGTCNGDKPAICP